ncbi:MAG: phage tail tape measure protein, partial [Alphaproteobacteria bacterium]|nr:phage tail tape measure protein [Alphaproteobacteria bacterium]
MAEQLGVSTDALQAYQFAATQSGIKSEELNTALARLSRTVGEAANGSTNAIKAFRDLGVGILDAGGNLRATEDILGDVATAIAAIDDPARRAAAAVDFFGKSGQKLLPLLSGGKQGLDGFIESARKAGVILDKDLIAAADKASDRISALTFKLTAFGKIAVAELTRLAQLGGEGFLSQDERSLERIIFDLDIATKKADEFRKRVANREAQGMPAGLDKAELAKWERMVNILQARKDFLAGPPPKTPETPAPGGATSNPRSEEETDAIKAATDALQKKVAAQRAEAEGQYQSAAAKAEAQATEETLIALRSKGIQGLNDEQKALISALGVQVKRIEAQKTEIENVKAYASTLNEYIDNATAAGHAEAVLAGEVIKTQQATEEQVRLLNEQADAAEKSTIRYNALTGQFELYDREVQIVAKSQELLAQNTALSTEEARRQAEQIVDASDRLKRSTDDVRKRVDNMNEAAQDFSRVIGSAFEDAVVSGGKFSDVLKGLEQDIARIALRLTVTKPLENALTGMLGGGGGFEDAFKSIFGGSSGGNDGFGTGSGFGNQDFGDFFADGGRPPVG